MTRQQELERRSKGIGGSDVAAILGVSEFGRNALDIYLSKVTKPDPEEKPSPHFERGIRLEPVVAQMYREQTGRQLRKGKFRRDAKHRHLVGTPDYIILADGKPPYENVTGNAGVLEIKTANRYALDKMRKDGLPMQYLFQLQHYMGICKMKWGAFAVLCPDPWEFLTFDVEFDEQLFNATVAKLNDFWAQHVAPRIPPIPEKSEPFAEAPKPKEGEPIFECVGTLWDQAVASYREAVELQQAGKVAVDFAKHTLLSMLPERDEHNEPLPGIYEGGGIRLYHREQAGRISFQQKTIEAVQPLDPIRVAALLTAVGMTTDVIEALFDKSRLDLDRFRKQGDPFRTTRIYDREKRDV